MFAPLRVHCICFVTIPAQFDTAFHFSDTGLVWCGVCLSWMKQIASSNPGILRRGINTACMLAFHCEQDAGGAAKALKQSGGGGLLTLGVIGIIDWGHASNTQQSHVRQNWVLTVPYPNSKQKFYVAATSDRHILIRRQKCERTMMESLM